MWNKPSELTNYKGNGYEIVFISKNSYSDSFTIADDSLQGWQKSNGHNPVIINEGIWKNAWNAIGLGIYEGFVAVWFGE